MSLYVYLYKKDVPSGMKVIVNNDQFFQNVQLQNDEITRKLLSAIDKAEYGNENMFLSRNKELGMIYKDYLSTGCKTLLNAYYYPDICFDMLECGRNVKYLMPLLTTGHLLLENPMIYILDDTNVDCDIVYNKKHYVKFDRFIEAIMKDRRTSRTPENYLDTLEEKEQSSRYISDLVNKNNLNKI